MRLKWVSVWKYLWATSPFPPPLPPQVGSVQFSRSVLSESLRPHESQQDQASLSITNSRSLPKLMSIKLVMPSSHLILCHPLLLLPPIPPSIRVFSSESALRMRCPKYWSSASASILPMNTQWSPLGWTGWISLQPKGLSRVFSNTTVQKHQSVLRRSAFFTVQISHPYVTTGKTIALTRWTFVGKVMSLLFNMLSRLVTWRRQWHPTPVLLPGKSHEQRSLVGCSPWDREESDTTEQLHFPFSLSCMGEGNGNPLQCSCLENPRDGGAWWAAVYGVAQSWTRLKRLSSGSSSNIRYKLTFFRV